SAAACFVPVTRYLPSGENAAAVTPSWGHANARLVWTLSQSSTTTGAGRPNEEGPHTASSFPPGLNTGGEWIASIPTATGVAFPVARSTLTSLPFGSTTAAVLLSPAVATYPLPSPAGSRSSPRFFPPGTSHAVTTKSACPFWVGLRLAVTRCFPSGV